MRALLKKSAFLYATLHTAERAVRGPVYAAPFIRDHLRDGDVVQDFLHTALSQTPTLLLGNASPMNPCRFRTSR